jgi:hypothetical protein
LRLIRTGAVRDVILFRRVSTHLPLRNRIEEHVETPEQSTVFGNGVEGDMTSAKRCVP